MRPSFINSTLPVELKVLKKYDLNRYILLLNNKELSTKSLIELELGASYISELYSQRGGVIEFKNLHKMPDLFYFEDGLKILSLFLQDEGFDFKHFLLSGILESKDERRYKIFKEMLFASAQKIYHLPLIFEDKKALFQMRDEGNFLNIYFYFSNLGPLKIFIFEDKIKIWTIFSKVENFLKKYLNYEIEKIEKIEPLFTLSKIKEKA